MGNLKDAIALMNPGCYFASLDLKDAYYSVKIHTDLKHFSDFTFMVYYMNFWPYRKGIGIPPGFLQKF